MSYMPTMNDLIKHALGFNRMAQDLENRTRQLNAGFPPFNISIDTAQNPSKYFLELAVAGYKRDEISVKLEEDDGFQLLTILGQRQETDENIEKYMVKQIASRSFTRTFTMTPNAEVESVTLKDGMLSITVNIKPEPQKREKLLTIN